jgi:hypothetical protein
MPNPQPCCQECGAALPPRKSAKGSAPKFCSAAHRAKFNNRRMTRGAMLYDLFMQGRYSEGRKDYGKNLGTMAQVARIFREADTLEIGGRKSWSDPNLDSHYDPLTEAGDRLDALRRELAS